MPRPNVCTSFNLDRRAVLQISFVFRCWSHVFRSGLYSSRGNFPSPTFRERQSAARGQSIQGPYNEQPSHTASTPSFSHRRSPPVAAQTVPGQIRLHTSPSYHSASRNSSKPPSTPLQPPNQQSIPFQMVSQQNHSHPANQTTSASSLPRAPRPRFTPLDAFQLTPELIAEIEGAHSMGLGMSGVAYAGGAISGPASRSTHLESSTLPEESTLGLAYSGEHSIPRRSGKSPTGTQHCNASSCDKDREISELHRCSSVERDHSQRISTQQPSPKLEFQRTDSPKYSHSLSNPGDHTSYETGAREPLLTQAAALSPSPPTPRQNPYTKPLSLTARPAAPIHDKFLPIHEF